MALFNPAGGESSPEVAQEDQAVCFLLPDTAGSNLMRMNDQ